VRAAAVVLAFLLATMNLHVGFPLVAGYGLAVPVPVLAAVVLVLVIAVMGWLIWLRVRPVASGAYWSAGAAA